MNKYRSTGRADANRQGFSDRSLRTSVSRGELAKIRRGAYGGPIEQLPPASQHRALVVATARELGPSTVISDWSAAVMHGLPVHVSLLTQVRVIRSGTCSNVAGRPTLARKANLQPHEVVLIDGVPCTSLARTVFDLAGTDHFPDALAIADAALRAGMSADDLPVGGRASARRALVTEHANPFRESYLESYSFARLIQLGMPLPELQPKLLGATGLLLGRGDFLWRDQGVIGEVDGLTKYTGAYGKSPEQTISDEKNRHQNIEFDGWVVVRWGFALMRGHQRGFADRIQAALARGAALPAPRSRILTPDDPEWHEWHPSGR